MIMALLALLLLAIIGSAFMLMNTSENAANGNYKESQKAYFASRAGLENVRALLIENAALHNLADGLAMPTTAGPNGVIYAINPTNGEAVDPKGNPYLDTELCHERFVNMVAGGLSAGTVGAPCGTGGPSELPTGNYYQTAAVTAGSTVVLTANEMPHSNTAGALPFKWVRITNKQNQMGLLNGQLVDNGKGPDKQVCWDGKQEWVVPGPPGVPADCPSMTSANADTMKPVWLLTSLAITPSGSRRITQMEVAFSPPIKVNATVSTLAPITLRGNLQVDGTDACTCLKPNTPLPGMPPKSCKSYNAIYDGTRFPNPGILPNGIPPQSLTGVNGITGMTVYNSLGQVTTQGATAQGPWPYDIPKLVDEFKTGALNATQQPWNYNCSQPTSTSFGSCSGGSGQTFGTYPTGTLPAAQGGGPDPTTGNPAVVYVPGSVRLTGNTTGDGILIVDGDLDIHGGLDFYGLILVTGSITFTGGGSQAVNLYGAVLGGQDVNATDAIGGSFNFHYDSCALRQFQVPGPPRLLATHEVIY